MTDADTGSRDRLAVAVFTQYRMATTEQMHLILSPHVQIEQTRRRLVKLRGEGLIDRVTLPQAGRMRVWYAIRYGAQVAAEWPELRGRRPPRGAHDRTAVRLGVVHGLTVTETGLAFLQDARRRGDLCQPLDWIPEVHHPLGGSEAVIPDALLYYRSHGTSEADTSRDGRDGGNGGSMLRAFVEVDRATMGPERLAAKIGAYARLHQYVPTPPPGARHRTAGQEPAREDWRRRYPLFPRLLFVLDATGPTGIHTRIEALQAAARGLGQAALLRDVPVLAAPMTDLLRHGPAAPAWHPVTDPDQRVGWMHSRDVWTAPTMGAEPGAAGPTTAGHSPVWGQLTT
ncbi:replication-relaxation family protein [Streptomyces flaveolus]|uniref:replication-relaxation family protein n=1 Tax=Streptomyces flaveolus TaxID=67297 RepID=UPI0034496B8E